MSVSYTHLDVYKRQTLYNAGSEVSNALSLYQNTSKKAESRQMQVESAKKASEDTKELFNLGTSTYLEVLSAQQSYLSAQISQVSDCFDKMQAVVSLYQALGLSLIHISATNAQF